MYGRVLGRRQGVEPGRDYDDELLYLGCVLQDLGLDTRGTGAGRFELDGADLARQFAVDNGVNRPEKAPPFTLAGELVRQQTGTVWPSWRDIAGSPGWGDY
jgi:hypothetical protein